MHAVIFDIDGTLLESAAVDDALYREAVRQVLGDVQLRPSLHAYDYVTDAGVFAQILEDNAIQAEQDAQHEIKERFVNGLRIVAFPFPMSPPPWALRQ